MVKKILLSSLLLIAVSCGVEADPPPPGWASAPNFKLSRIAPPELQQPCLWLEQGRLQEARRAFEAAMHQNSRNYLAAFGWIQTTTPGERNSLARSYEQALQQSPIAMDYFKAAILYLYLAYDANDLLERDARFRRCGEYARRAYELDPNPYTVILVYDCPIPTILKMLEEQMGSLLGKESMRFYLEAKQKSWRFAVLPPIEHLSLQNLRLLRVIVGMTLPEVLKVERGLIVENKPDPKNPKHIQVETRYTAYGIRAEEYFRKWKEALDQAIERKQKG
ncbi:MAG: hypothetical protein RMM06_07180 [Armatimonadota bacterium]|nr:hypothetical protein [Armatimonadota bacterium]